MTDFNRTTTANGLKREKSDKSEKLALFMQKMESLMESGFTGYVKINFSQGSIGRVEKFEEILKELRMKVR